MSHSGLARPIVGVGENHHRAIVHRGVDNVFDVSCTDFGISLGGQASFALFAVLFPNVTQSFEHDAHAFFYAIPAPVDSTD